MSHDDLIDKYSNLDSKYNQLKKDNDELLQEIHSLKSKILFKYFFNNFNKKNKYQLQWKKIALC